MKILLHICCACCAVSVFSLLKEKFNQVVGFWYNPNIQPYSEYLKRLNTLKELQAKKHMEIVYNDNYEVEKYLEKTKGKESKRCEICYEIRLYQTIEYAKKFNFDYWTTTLLISPYQKIDKIKEIGEKLQNDFHVKFYFENFTPYFKESISCAKELNLYRQKYCGCSYSRKC